MEKKVTEEPEESEQGNSFGGPNWLLDLRTLVVLLVSVGAGWLAYRQGGWTPALTVGIGTAVALHALVRRPRR